MDIVGTHFFTIGENSPVKVSNVVKANLYVKTRVFWYRLERSGEQVVFSQ